MRGWIILCELPESTKTVNLWSCMEVVKCKVHGDGWPVAARRERWKNSSSVSRGSVVASIYASVVIGLRSIKFGGSGEVIRAHRFSSEWLDSSASKSNKNCLVLQWCLG